MSAVVTVATAVQRRVCLMHRSPTSVIACVRDRGCCSDPNLFQDPSAAVNAAMEKLASGYTIWMVYVQVDIRASCSEIDVVYTDGHSLDVVLPVVQSAAKSQIPIVADLEVLQNNGQQTQAGDAGAGRSCQGVGAREACHSPDLASCNRAGTCQRPRSASGCVLNWNLERGLILGM